MRDASRPTLTPEIYERFTAYHHAPGNGAWGSLHIVLEDYNLEDSHVEFCVGWAEKEGDTEGAELAKILLTLTRTQRGRLAKRIPAPPFDMGERTVTVTIPKCGVQVPKGPSSWWMNQDQYEAIACHCVLDNGHEGPHQCADTEHDPWS